MARISVIRMPNVSITYVRVGDVDVCVWACARWCVHVGVCAWVCARGCACEAASNSNKRQDARYAEVRGYTRVCAGVRGRARK